MQTSNDASGDTPSTEEHDKTLEALQTAFQTKYDVELPTDVLTPLVKQYGIERVKQVIDRMKDDAYNPTSFLRRSLSSGWYQHEQKQKPNWTETNGRGNGGSEAEATTRQLWKMKLEFGFCTKEEQEYMLDVILHGAQPDAERIRQIRFGVLQKVYPKIPSRWFYWLKQSEARQAANDWIANSGRSELPLYEII
jgi:hypothetical protein